MRKRQKANLLALIFTLIIIVILAAIYLIVGQNSSTPVPQQPATTTVGWQPASTNEIVRGDTTKKQVIFTFDGGSGAVSGNKILDTLKKHNVKGTFFLTGKFVEANTALTQKIVAEGHEIFNHTYDHPHLPTLTDEAIIAQFDRMNDAFYEVTGSSTRPYFRPPFGERNAHVLGVAAENGYQSVYWTIDALDWKPGITADEVTKKILDGVKPGTIYLMHIGDTITGAILDNVFTTIEGQGYKIVSLTQGL